MQAPVAENFEPFVEMRVFNEYNTGSLAVSIGTVSRNVKFVNSSDHPQVHELLRRDQTSTGS